MTRHACFTRIAPSLLFALAACGGKVVAEPSGGSGASGAAGGQTSSSNGASNGAGASGTTGTSATTGTTGAGGTTTTDCASLEAAYVTALAAAVACDPCIDFDECMNGPTLYDTCGCPVGGSISKKEEYQAAFDAYNAWTMAGCGPHDCGKPCVSPGGAWTCKQSGEGCVGTCQPATF